MGSKVVKIKKNDTSSPSLLVKLRKENMRLRDRLDHYNFVLIDILHSLESMEQSCKDLLEGRD